MSTAFLSIPLIIFLVFIAPLWLWLHYRAKRQTQSEFSQDEQQQMQQLLTRVETLQQRLHTLERILDEDAPSWRHKV